METPISWIVIRHEAPAGRFPVLLTGAVVALLLAMATLAACSTGSPSPQRTSIASQAPTSGRPPTPAGSSGSALTVTGVEYAFQGIPHTAPAGTVVTFANAGKEVHQMIAARRNDGVTASLEELLAMPEAESGKLVTILGGPVASPGETAADRIILDRPGTWFFVCFIPVGTTSLPSLAPGATPNEALMPEGPPHFLQGMVAELTVTEPVVSSPTILASREPSTPPAPSISPSTQAPTTQTVESARHGYRVEVPAGWTFHEYEGAWNSLSQFTPGGEIPGEDAVAPPDFSSFLVMNSMAIPAGMTDSKWLATFEALVSAGLPADCPGTTRSGTFAGEPATILEQTCNSAAIVGRSLVHDGRGYYFTTMSPYPDPTRNAIVDRMAASVEFIE